MTNQIAVIILAAGKGTRMKSSTPKVLHKICDKPMIEHVIDTAKSINPVKIVAVLSDGMRDVAEQIKDRCEVVVQKQQLGTGDAVKPALTKLKGFKGEVVILYADTPLIKKTTIIKMLNNLASSDIVVLGFSPDNPSEYGRLVLNQFGNLLSIIECKDATEAERANKLCNSGVIAANAEVLSSVINKIENKNAKNEYYLTDIITLANKINKKCSFIEGDVEEVMGVNNREQLSCVEAVFQRRMRHEMMIDGATLIDPDSVRFSFDTKIGKDVTIEPNVTFGPGVSVEDGVYIKSFCHIEGAQIHKGAVIGPFARIRPGSDIQSDARIGNFVEIKKSNIGKGAKIGHLTYIGDAEVGEDANIGAGTVTCNYDGKNKHKTKIGKSAFIGSNSSLVAPVNIGDKAFIGAGSTITKDVSDKALAVARGKQVSKKDWSN